MQCKLKRFSSLQYGCVKLKKNNVILNLFGITASLSSYQEEDFHKWLIDSLICNFFNNNCSYCSYHWSEIFFLVNWISNFNIGKKSSIAPWWILNIHYQAKGKYHFNRVQWQRTLFPWIYYFIVLRLTMLVKSAFRFSIAH